MYRIIKKFVIHLKHILTELFDLFKFKIVKKKWLSTAFCM